MNPLFPRELHTTGRPSATAQWTTLSRALEAERPGTEQIVTDPFASVFLTGGSRGLLTALRTAGPALRLLERGDVASLSTSVLCRHRFLDEHLLLALPDVEQVVILGAGYDARAYRFRDEIGERPVFEVDLPPLSRRKAAIVAARPDLFEASVHRVEIDFRTQALADRLGSAGFAAGAPTFVVWEGVSMYLSRDAVLGTLAALGEACGPGSILAMDAWRRVGGLRPYDQLRRLGEQAMSLIGEPITFAVDPATLSALLDAAGFTVADLAMADDLTRRYATDGRRCDDGLYVLAARRR